MLWVILGCAVTILIAAAVIYWIVQEELELERRLHASRRPPHAIEGISRSLEPPREPNEFR